MEFNVTSLLNLPPYGAVELKRYYRKFFIRALILASSAHLFLVGSYRIYSLLAKKEEPITKVIRITKYNELIPLIERIEQEYSELLAGDRTGAEWSGGLNGENIVIGTGEGTGSGVSGRQGERMASSDARRLARESLSKEISQKGLLGMLEASGYVFREGGGSEGGGGGGITREELENIFSSIDESKSGGTPMGGRVGGTEEYVAEPRGSRSSKQATIDDVVVREKTIRSESLSRQGELQVETAIQTEGRGVRNASRSPDAIQKILMVHVPAVRYCYERELRRNPELKGKVTVRITVGPEGSVKDASIITSTLSDERVERCILSRIRMWKDFPAIDPGEGDVSFRQAYSFGY